MTEEVLPDPLVPSDVDLTDFAFMPLEVQRLRNSELASDETPESCWAAVLLWCAAWHEVPAASIPDNDQWQAKQCGYVARGRIDPQWAKVKPGALRNFVACSDGRLYHSTLAKKALESWESKLRHAYGKMLDRLRKLNKARADQELPPVPPPSFESWNSAGRADPVPPEVGNASAGIPPEKALKGIEGTGRSKGQGDSPEKNPSGSRRLATTGKRLPDPTPTIPCPYDAIVDAYHRELPSLPKVRLRDGPTWDDRQKAMRVFWGWVLSSRKSDGTRRAETAEQALEWIAAYFRRAADNDFVMGRSRPGQGHEGWRADLEYLLSKRGLKQVIEKTVEAAA